MAEFLAMASVGVGVALIWSGFKGEPIGVLLGLSDKVTTPDLEPTLPVQTPRILDPEDVPVIEPTLPVRG